MGEADTNIIAARATIVFTSFSIYDTLLTLDDEIELIWKSAKSSPLILYLILRYLSLASLIFHVYATISTHLSPAFCRFTFPIRSWGSTVIVPMADIFIILRVFALYNNQIKVGVLLVILWMAQIASVVTAEALGATSMLMMDNPLPGKLPGCFPVVPFRDKLILQAGIVTIAIQVVYLGLSMNVLLRRLWQCKTRLIQALFRDAVLYCVMMIVLFSLNLWLLMSAKCAPLNEIGDIGLVAFVSSMTSRFVLDLRKSTWLGSAHCGEPPNSTINWIAPRRQVDELHEL